MNRFTWKTQVMRDDVASSSKFITVDDDDKKPYYHEYACVGAKLPEWTGPPKEIEERKRSIISLLLEKYKLVLPEGLSIFATTKTSLPIPAILMRTGLYIDYSKATMRDVYAQLYVSVTRYVQALYGVYNTKAGARYAPEPDARDLEWDKNRESVSGIIDGDSVPVFRLMTDSPMFTGTGAVVLLLSSGLYFGKNTSIETVKEYLKYPAIRFIIDTWNAWNPAALSYKRPLSEISKEVVPMPSIATTTTASSSPPPVTPSPAAVAAATAVDLSLKHFPDDAEFVRNVGTLPVYKHITAARMGTFLTERGVVIAPGDIDRQALVPFILAWMRHSSPTPLQEKYSPPMPLQETRHPSPLPLPEKHPPSPPTAVTKIEKKTEVATSAAVAKPAKKSESGTAKQLAAEYIKNESILEAGQLRESGVPYVPSLGDAEEFILMENDDKRLMTGSLYVMLVAQDAKQQSGFYVFLRTDKDKTPSGEYTFQEAIDQMSDPDTGTTRNYLVANAKHANRAFLPRAFRSSPAGIRKPSPVDGIDVELTRALQTDPFYSVCPATALREQYETFPVILDHKRGVVFNLDERARWKSFLDRPAGAFIHDYATALTPDMGVAAGAKETYKWTYGKLGQAELPVLPKFEDATEIRRYSAVRDATSCPPDLVQRLEDILEYTEIQLWIRVPFSLSHRHVEDAAVVPFEKGILLLDGDSPCVGLNLLVDTELAMMQHMWEILNRVPWMRKLLPSVKLGESVVKKRYEPRNVQQLFDVAMRRDLMAAFRDVVDMVAEAGMPVTLINHTFPEPYAELAALLTSEGLWMRNDGGTTGDLDVVHAVRELLGLPGIQYLARLGMFSEGHAEPIETDTGEVEFEEQLTQMTPQKIEEKVEATKTKLMDMYDDAVRYGYITAMDRQHLSELLPKAPHNFLELETLTTRLSVVRATIDTVRGLISNAPSEAAGSKLKALATAVLKNYDDKAFRTIQDIEREHLKQLTTVSTERGVARTVASLFARRRAEGVAASKGDPARGPDLPMLAEEDKLRSRPVAFSWKDYTYGRDPNTAPRIFVLGAAIQTKMPIILSDRGIVLVSATIDDLTRNTTASFIDTQDAVRSLQRDPEPHFDLYMIEYESVVPAGGTESYESKELPYLSGLKREYAVYKKTKFPTPAIYKPYPLYCAFNGLVIQPDATDREVADYLARPQCSYLWDVWLMYIASSDRPEPEQRRLSESRPLLLDRPEEETTTTVPTADPGTTTTMATTPPTGIIH